MHRCIRLLIDQLVTSNYFYFVHVVSGAQNFGIKIFSVYIVWMCNGERISICASINL